MIIFSTRYNLIDINYPDKIINILCIYELFINAEGFDTGE